MKDRFVQVALIDDDRQVRENLGFLLDGSGGCKLTHAFATIDAARLALRKLEIDVLLLDVGLGTDSGLDALPSLRTAFPNLKILLHSNYDEEAKIVSAFEAGATGYVLKNQGSLALTAAITAAFRGEQSWPPGFDRRRLEQKTAEHKGWRRMFRPS